LRRTGRTRRRTSSASRRSIRCVQPRQSRHRRAAAPPSCAAVARRVGRNTAWRRPRSCGLSKRFGMLLRRSRRLSVRSARAQPALSTRLLRAANQQTPIYDFIPVYPRRLVSPAQLKSSPADLGHHGHRRRYQFGACSADALAQHLCPMNALRCTPRTDARSRQHRFIGTHMSTRCTEVASSTLAQRLQAAVSALASDVHPSAETACVGTPAFGGGARDPTERTALA